MTNSITNRQMGFVLLITTGSVATIILPRAMAVTAGQGAWAVILATSLIFCIIISIIIWLNKNYEGKTLFEYSREIAGKTISYIISWFYILYFILADLYLCYTFANLLYFEFLPRTPKWATLFIGIAVFGLLAFRGITNLARLIEIIGPLLVLGAVFIFITMLVEGKINYLLPLFNTSKINDYIKAMKDTFTAFLGIEVLTIIPFTKKNKKAGISALFTVIGIGILYVLAVEGCIAMIGVNEIIYHSFPLIDAIRLVRYPEIEFLQRIDILYMTMGFGSIFCAKSFVYLVIVEYLGKIFAKVNRLYIVIFVGLLIYSLALFLSGVPGIFVIISEIILYAGILSAFIFPFTLFIIARFKKNGQKVDTGC